MRGKMFLPIILAFTALLFCFPVCAQEQRTAGTGRRAVGIFRRGSQTRVRMVHAFSFFLLFLLLLCLAAWLTGRKTDREQREDVQEK